MAPQAAGFEQRLADLEAQIDRLNVTLERVRETEDHLPPVGRRLSELTDELETRLNGWSEMEARLQRDAFWRFQGLERTIEREWASLRQIHEEPARQLREQAESLTEICVSTAGSAQTGLERAEARLATIEHDLHRRIDDLSRDLHAVLAELQHRNGGGLRGPANPWSLEEVTRLHHELRENNPDAHPALPTLDVSDATRFEPVAANPAVDPVEPVENAQIAATPDAPARTPWTWYAAIAVMVVAVGVAGVFALSFYTRANLAAERASDAQARAEQIATSADERIDAARRAALAEVTQARAAAAKAQITAEVLAASDLVRFNLIGGESASRASAQFLWSRSRGMVFSASHLAQPPADSVYQIWLLTDTDPVSAGLAAPDDSGRVTTASDTPPDVPRPVVGVRVTVEASPGSRSPSGTVVLSRPPRDQ